VYRLSLARLLMMCEMGACHVSWLQATAASALPPRPLCKQGATCEQKGRSIAFSPIFRSQDHSRALLELAVTLMAVERGTAADNLALLDNAGATRRALPAAAVTLVRAAPLPGSCGRGGINVLCSVGQEALANRRHGHGPSRLFPAGHRPPEVVQPSHVVLRRERPGAAQHQVGGDIRMMTCMLDVLGLCWSHPLADGCSGRTLQQAFMRGRSSNT